MDDSNRWMKIQNYLSSVATVNHFGNDISLHKFSKRSRSTHIWRRKLQPALPLLLRPFRESIRKNNWKAARVKRANPKNTAIVSDFYHALPPGKEAVGGGGDNGRLVVCLEMTTPDVSASKVQLILWQKLMSSLTFFFRFFCCSDYLAVWTNLKGIQQLLAETSVALHGTTRHQKS